MNEIAIAAIRASIIGTVLNMIELEQTIMQRGPGRVMPRTVAVGPGRVV